MASPKTAKVTPLSNKPKEYWQDSSLYLTVGSVDEKHAKAKRTTANVPHNYVSDVQNDLISLGYLVTGSDDGDYGSGTKRAVKRFQRHANRKIRMQNELKVTVTGVGLAVSGICNNATAN